MKKLMLLALLCSNFAFAENLEPSIQPMVDTSQFTTFLSNDGKLDTVLKEIKCENYLHKEGRRRKVVRGVKNPMMINEGMLHIGQTLEGDVISFEKVDGKNMYTLYFCERMMVANELDIDFIVPPILNGDLDCDVAQVSAADLSVPTNSGKYKDGSDILSPYQLAFFPLGMSQASSLCRERVKFPEAQAMEMYRNLIKEGLVPASESRDSDASQVSTEAVKVD